MSAPNAQTLVAVDIPFVRRQTRCVVGSTTLSIKFTVFPTLDPIFQSLLHILVSFPALETNLPIFQALANFPASQIPGTTIVGSSHSPTLYAVEFLSAHNLSTTPFCKFSTPVFILYWKLLIFLSILSGVRSLTHSAPILIRLGIVSIRELAEPAK
jgi:hypothetical protein